MESSHAVDYEIYSYNMSGNYSGFELMPSFDDYALAKVIVCCFMIFFSTVGNVATFITLYRIRRRKSTVNMLILHLAIADLTVTYTLMLSNAIWYGTVRWLGGNFMCKIVKFLVMFGLYMSTFIMVAISVDRYIAIIHPLSRNQGPQRVKIMIMVAYAFSALFSLPQVLIFRVVKGAPDFDQCLADGLYKEVWQEQLYTMLVFLVMYAFPLVIMISAYLAIFILINKKSNEKDDIDKLSQIRHTRSLLFLKAKVRTLRMTMLIVMTFIINWTPYYAMIIWYMFFDWDVIPHEMFEIAWLFGMSNSAFNPVVYGISNLRFCGKRKTYSIRSYNFEKKCSSSPAYTSSSNKCTKTPSSVLATTRRMSYMHAQKVNYFSRDRN
ncbi:gonadotropin-releasing hormone receptor-like [Saccoglossus kowalevskii]|uniref:Gonadotropin-releasing hormone receptor-like n=1 Tax=Saccoglossus kowalevskii TaxID=10224 RepID=A0ABM0MLD6_SACKO|nr:PREDICTED: gonadotropin-releasing hormone receptor-like [Saccoglossus kowalevskii]